MKRFYFRLAQIERLRQAEEAMEKRILQERLAALAQAESDLEEAKNRLTDYSERLASNAEQPLPAYLLASYRQWYNWLLDQVHEQGAVVADRLSAVEDQREKVREVRLQTKTLEQLREKQLLHHRQTSSQDEQKQLDELALYLEPAGMGERH